MCREGIGLSVSVGVAKSDGVGGLLQAPIANVATSSLMRKVIALCFIRTHSLLAWLIDGEIGIYWDDQMRLSPMRG